jgi:cytochrome b
VGHSHPHFSLSRRYLPAAVLVRPRQDSAYLQGRQAAGAGHNPLGSWSVLVLLVLLLMQAISGLFNSDGIFFNGPLYYAVTSEWRDTLGLVHDVNFDALLVFVSLPLAIFSVISRHGRFPGVLILFYCGHCGGHTSNLLNLWTLMFSACTELRKECATMAPT